MPLRISYHFVWLLGSVVLLFYSIRSFPSAASSTTRPATDTTQRLDPANLLLYRDASGKIVQGHNKFAWQKRRSEILNGMQKVMGPLPGKEKRSPLDIKVDEEVDCGSYVRQLINYASEPNSRVPAYLLIPKEAFKKKVNFPAVLCPHPTDMQLGHKIVVGLGGKRNCDYARELAQRGYVTLAPAYPLMANYQPDLKALGYQSGTMKAIWDNVRGLDLLESLPYVKRTGFGAIGHSLGGHNSIYTAVFDPRIKVVASSCGFDSYVDYMDGNIQGWTQERYMPKLAAYASSLSQIPFDFHEMIAALAPRVCFVSAPKADSNFKWQSVDAVAKSASKIYQLYDVPQNLRVEHPDCDHDFPDEMRARAYQILDQNLKD